MIKEIPLEESKHFDTYKFDTYLYERGIKADTCIMIGDLETYYNKKDEIVYVESFEFFEAIDKTIVRNGEITRKMIEELTKYLGWKNWSIKLHYYDYEEAMITIRLKKEKKDFNHKMLSMDSFIDDIKQIIPEKPSIQLCGEKLGQKLE